MRGRFEAAASVEYTLSRRRRRNLPHVNLPHLAENFLHRDGLQAKAAGAGGLYNAQVSGPNRTTAGSRSSAAKCAGPLSLVTLACASGHRAGNSRNVVRPAQLT
jgi:hypothetical protein